MNEEIKEWDLIIEPKSRLFDLKLREVWLYRDLLGLLVKRDFVAFYKQTILGPIWFFIQPLFTMVMYVFVFGKLAGLSTDNIAGPLFYLSGITAWTYFSECLTKTATVFRDNASIFGKVYFPRLIIPLSVVVSSLVRFGVQLFLLVIVMIYFSITTHSVTPSIYILLYPVLLVLMAAQGLGMGMIISAMTTKYRDLVLLLTFGVQLLMYGTTVVYPLSSMSGNMHVIIALNPMTYIIEGMRKGLFGHGSFTAAGFLYVTIVSIVLLFAGVIVFNKVEKTFIDTV